MYRDEMKALSFKFYKPMHPEPLYQPTDFHCVASQEFPDVFVPETIDIELATQNSKQQA
jgi:hypothetical protein